MGMSHNGDVSNKDNKLLVDYVLSVMFQSVMSSIATHTCTLSLLHMHIGTNAHSPSLSLSLSHTHTHVHRLKSR